MTKDPVIDIPYQPKNNQDLVPTVNSDFKLVQSSWKSIHISLPKYILIGFTRMPELNHEKFFEQQDVSFFRNRSLRTLWLLTPNERFFLKTNPSFKQNILIGWSIHCVVSERSPKNETSCGSQTKMNIFTA